MGEHDNIEIDQAVELALLRRDMDMMRADMAELKSEVKSLVDAWKTATGFVAFIKWLAAGISAMGVLWYALAELYKRH